MLVYTTLNLLWQKNKHPYKYVYRKVQNYLNEGNVVVCFFVTFYGKFISKGDNFRRVRNACMHREKFHYKQRRIGHTIPESCFSFIS